MDLQELIEKELSQEPNSEELISLIRNIFQWYDEGGPSTIKDNLLKHLKEADLAVKNMKGITPEVKKSKKKVKKRK